MLRPVKLRGRAGGRRRRGGFRPRLEALEDRLPPGDSLALLGTRTGTPLVQGVNEIVFSLILPSGPVPDGGWPVAIFCDGSGGNLMGSRWLAASIALQGVATISINPVGHGYGPFSNLTVNQTAGGALTFSAGGRGIDQNNDQIIGASEGVGAVSPHSIIWERDSRQQTAADLMQLVRVIQVGMDVDGDESRDLDPSRIHFFGFSMGGIIGASFLAVEPDVRVGVLNVPGGSIVDTRRLNPAGRAVMVANRLGARVPSLLNPPGLTSIDSIPVDEPRFDENLPRRNQPAVINTVPGADAIQKLFDNTEWVSQAGNPVAYAPHLRKAPLEGVPAKSVIVQFARGDRNVANPTTTALLRADELADRATFYRNDLAIVAEPLVPANPHQFFVRIASAELPLVAAIALGTQGQIATFFASGGTTIIHPEPSRYFEVPIQGPLPENLNYIP